MLRTRMAGYQCSFLAPPSDALVCQICLFVARNPKQHEVCGRLFCEGCLQKLPHPSPVLPVKIQAPPISVMSEVSSSRSHTSLGEGVPQSTVVTYILQSG